MKKNHQRLLLLIVLALAALLRIYRLGLYDLWFDEVLCAFQREDLGNILNGRILDSNPPLYFLILHFFTLPGKSEFVLRLPSVIFGVMTVYALYWFSRRLFDENTALIGSFLLCISPFHIYYSQEVKMYSLFILLSFLSIFFLILSIRDNENLYWTGFAVSLSLALYTHYYAILLAFIETVTFFIFLATTGKREVAKKWLISNAAAGLLFLPWIPVMLKEHFFKTSGFVTSWIPRPGIKSLLYTFKNFCVGFSSPRWNYIAAVIIFGLILISGLVELYKRKELFVLIFGFFFLPPLILFLISQYRPIYLDRYISFIVPLFCLIVSLGVSRFSRQIIIVFLLVAAILSGFGYMNLYETIPFINQAPGEHERIPIKPVVKYIEERFQEGDMVGHSCRSTLLSFEYYSERKQNFLAVNSFEKYPQSSAWKHSSLLPGLVPDAIKGAKRIWLVLSWWDPTDYIDPISMELKEWMDRNFELISSKKFNGIDLFLYESKL